MTIVQLGIYYAALNLYDIGQPCFTGYYRVSQKAPCTCQK